MSTTFQNLNIKITDYFIHEDNQGPAHSRNCLMEQGTSLYAGKKPLPIISNGTGGQVCCCKFATSKLLFEEVMITFIGRRSKYLSGKTFRVSEGITVSTQGSKPLRALSLDMTFQLLLSSAIFLWWANFSPSVIFVGQF